MRLPGDHPDRARRAADLISVLLAQPPDSSSHLFRYVDELVEAADRNPSGTDPWPRTRRAACVMSLMYRMSEGTAAELDSAATALEGLAVEAVGDPEMTTLVQCARMVLMLRQVT